MSGLLIALAKAAAGATAPDWIQLLPAGEAKPDDSRPAWHVDPAKVIAATKLPLAIDIDHETDLGEKGKPVPSQGWIEELKPVGPAGEPGVWGRVEWTARGATAVASKEYRFVSPVFRYGHDLVVGKLQRVSLTNDPALTLKALATRERHDPETSMSLSLKIAALIGLAATATEDEILAAITKNGETSKALATRLVTIGEAAGLKDVKEIGDDHVVGIATKLKSSAAPVDETKYVSIAKFDQVQLALATMQAERSKDAAASKVDAALKNGKIVPAQREWAVGYATRDPEGFDAFVGASPKILDGGKLQLVQPKDGEITAEQKAMCTALGISEKEFALGLGKPEEVRGQFKAAA